MSHSTSHPHFLAWRTRQAQQMGCVQHPMCVRLREQPPSPSESEQKACAQMVQLASSESDPSAMLIWTTARRDMFAVAATAGESKFDRRCVP